MFATMISVIVPVYNVEPYLRKCLDSIVYQTYKNLEILVVDDGSTDECGRICDEYEEKDERIRVFHTENRGLSCARNLGLDEARGEWIGFVDSDDWIEPDMYEVLLKEALETGADVVDCGVYWESPGKTVEIKKQYHVLTGRDALRELLHQKIYNAVWNKLWKHKCFDSIRFPAGRICEDIATTYRVFASIVCVSILNKSKYHYLRRDNSISTTCDMNNLVGYWLSHKERYDFLQNQVDEEEKLELIRFCALAAVRTWAHYFDSSKEERRPFQMHIQQIYNFTKQYIPLFGCQDWNALLRIGVFFPHFYSVLSFWMAWMLNRLLHLLFPK